MDKLYLGEDVQLGIGDDAAVVLPPSQNQLMLHTVDYFRAFLSDNYLLGRIAAVHALSDIYAMNGRASTALATCIIPYGLPSKVEAELTHLLAGVAAGLKDERCSLVGGHSAEGAEVAIGITVNGVVEKTQLFAGYCAREGDAIILTKGLGTGAILAADMKCGAKGVWVWKAILNMLQSNRIAARVLFDHGCRTVTDITGFGLIGHLAQLLQNDNHESTHMVRMQLNNVPVLDGAVECIKAGFVSSLQKEVSLRMFIISNTFFSITYLL